MFRIKFKNKTWRSSVVCALVIFPAVVLGVIAMIAEGIAPALWGQQAAALIMFALLGLLCRAARRIPSGVWVSVLLAALAATLFFPAVGDTKRWLDLGLIHVNAAMLALPALLLLLGDMKCPHPALIFTAAILCLQPDLSQLAAFSLGALPALWQHRRNARWTVVSLVLLAVLAIRCFKVPTALEPAAYSEGILPMLGNFSPLMQPVGVLALAVVPGYFFCRFFKDRAAEMMGLAIYYAVAMLFSITGEYPVPLMGFGLSPIAGYWLASLWISGTGKE